ncbi:MAG: hypothetical protein KKH75_07615 [Actinobacteria bacterium]|nr:hypothetical protein [Actinomycetota bacterium]
MISVRRVMMTLGLAFTGYLAARGLWWNGADVNEPAVMVGALAFYLVTTWLCIFIKPRRPRDAAEAPASTRRATARMPLWASGLAVLTAVVVPTTITLSAGLDVRSASFVTWYIGGIGALMAIVMVGRRPWAAWLGTGALTVASMILLGPLPALALGLVGSLMWVTAAQLLMASIDRAARDTAQLTELQRTASSWQAAQSGRRRERRIQVQRALAIAGPFLARTIETGGIMTDEERRGALLAEGQLRDELRGARLLDDGVRAALDGARRRGTTVTVFDEGGLDGLPDEDLDVIRAELAQTIGSARSARLYIRTSPDPTIAVTVVGRSVVGAGLSEEDSVDLWREIAHPSSPRPGREPKR